MNRVEAIGKITTLSARFVAEVEGFNATNQYHINIHAESFLIPVLNEVLGINLENLNITQKKNFPAIDLADFKNRVAFQITATSNQSKIISTLKTFFEQGLDKQFDSLYFYILSQKKPSYSEKQINKVIPQNFHFDAANQILDKDSLLQKINAISSTPRIQTILKLYEHEFSDVQIEMRKHKFEAGFLDTGTELICPNLIPISFPRIIYKAELNLDVEGITKRVNEYLQKMGKKPVKKIKKEKLVQNALRENNAYCDEWLLHEGWLYTLRNLQDNNEPLAKIVDTGTITEIECKDFYSATDDNDKVFKYLLRKTLGGLCKSKYIQWFGHGAVYRFSNNKREPRQKQIRWKGKKESTKTVIFSIINKKEGHVICFRNLAFRASFLNIEDNWYLVLNPTWSFTNPGGYGRSRFEPGYMSGIKRLENNGSVYNYFRFFGYYLSYSDLFTAPYPYLTIGKTERISFSPKIDEEKWKPVKIPDSISTPAVELKADNELQDITLFDE